MMFDLDPEVAKMFWWYVLSPLLLDMFLLYLHINTLLVLTLILAS